MGDRMRCVPFKELIERMLEEYVASASIFGIPEQRFYRKSSTKQIEIFGELCETPLGPAAGPHTQLAQNIVAAYLTGSRFIELKTVQKLDSLEIPKPCIDAADEGFNTEWSTELSLEEAYDEYLKAWMLLHLLERLFKLKVGDGERSFVFNMSVGYDLEGIETERMDRYINDMMDSGGNALFTRYISELNGMIADGAFLDGTGLDDLLPLLTDLTSRIPASICSSVTLSTMHGCPPHEIEAICSYMLTEKGLDTYVKLNPTLLGFDRVRKILDDLGFGYVSLKRESFEHDLQYQDAVAMLRRLAALARERGRRFGVKLTNTLGSVNDRGALPGEEMYMSGRALFPLSINLAARLSEEFDGALPISYSGGITMHNVVEVFETGIRPVTVATDMLKPGGYLRMCQLADTLECSDAWDMGAIDAGKLTALAKRSLESEYSKKGFRGTDEVSIDGGLPLFDCYAAPCVAACPINQDVPEYIRLVGEGRYRDALALIYERNALPSITGHLCDHQCQQSCTRLDYEGCLQIREIKRLAVGDGYEELVGGWKGPEASRDAGVAIVGAGPAGLAAAYFLSREGFHVTVFDRNESAGGVVEHVVPQFRIPREAIRSDIEFIEAHGVSFVFGADPEFTIQGLRDQGFKYVLVAIGAYGTRPLPLEGDNESVMPSLEFLQAFNKDQESLEMGRVVATVGAGDTAMDTARAALKVKGVEESYIMYRRAKEQMPASREEYEDALADGVKFMWLRNPERFDADGTLTCRVMALGERDSSGRARPVPTDETVTLHVDTLLPSIGDKPDAGVLARAGLPVNGRGWVEVDEHRETRLENVYLIGDANTGPSTIVRCIAEGRRAADAICRKEDPAWKWVHSVPELDGAKRARDITMKRGRIASKPGLGYSDARAFAEREAFRCLECNVVCNKCVEVCPNRANVAVKVTEGEGFEDPFEIVHIDAYCNECGNCAQFCPWDGRPYTDKPTVFSMMEDFEASENPGYYLAGAELHVRLEGQVAVITLEEGRVVDDGSLASPNSRHFLLLFERLFKERPALFRTLAP